MARRVVVSTRAKGEIEALDRWWRENRPAALALFRQELAAALDLIAAAPWSGARYRSSPVPRVRRALLRSTRCHVYYVVQAAEIEVLAVWSAVRGTGPGLRS